MAPDDPDDSEDNYFDLRVQQYRGEPVLTYYQGPSEGGRGYGDIFILDESYQEVAQVTTTGDLGPGNADFHDTTTITEDDTIGARSPPTPCTPRLISAKWAAQRRGGSMRR